MTCVLPTVNEQEKANAINGSPFIGPRKSAMIQKALTATLIGTLGAAVLVSTSTEGRSQDYPSSAQIDQVLDHHVSIDQQGTGNSVLVEQGGTAPQHAFVSMVRSWLGYGRPGATETSLYSATILQNGSDHQATVHQYGSGHQAAANIDQKGTSNSSQVGQWGTALKADVHQNGENLAVQVDQFGDNRSFAINQFGLGTGLPVTVRQY
jgi:hypothetical protein